MNPLFANLTVDIKYAKELKTLLTSHEVRLVGPIMIDVDATAMNFTVVGEQEKVQKLSNKFESEAKAVKRAHDLIQEKTPMIDEVSITKEVVTDLQILLNTCKDVNDFINCI